MLRFHTREYLERIKALSADNGGDAGEFTPFGPGGYEIAAARSRRRDQRDRRRSRRHGRQRLRPHRARPATMRSPTSAAASASSRTRRSRRCTRARRSGLERVAVVDWDVHHGNGTQKAFYDRPDRAHDLDPPGQLLPARLRHVHETGEGPGEGYHINIPLPPGSGVGAYVAAFERVVAPALRAFKPELIIVASGLDASAMDPLARMMVHERRLPAADADHAWTSPTTSATAGSCRARGGLFERLRPLLRARGRRGALRHLERRRGSLPRRSSRARRAGAPAAPGSRHRGRRGQPDAPGRGVRSGAGSR